MEPKLESPTQTRPLGASARHGEVDALKGMAIIGVLIAHMSFESRFNASALSMIGTLQVFFGWCVIAFFFASGLLIKTGSATLLESYELIRKKSVRLLLPAVVFSLSYKLLQLGLYLTGRFSWDSPIPHNAHEVVLFILSPVGPQFYFLYYLYFISIAASLFEALFNRTALFVCASVLLPASYFFMDMPETGYGQINNLLPVYFFAYVVGYALSIQYDEARPVFYLMLVVPVVAAAVISSSYVAGYLLVPFILWYAFKKVPVLSSLVNKSRLGRYSASIYVWHAPIVMPLVSILCVKLLGGRPVVLLPVIVLTVAISLLLNQVTLKSRILRPWRF